MVVNGKGIADVKMIDGKTYVQLRAVGEAWGATVNWNDKTNTATVSK
ncbi:stalk domain-containing protein [Paenibacillus polymyxa]